MAFVDKAFGDDFINVRFRVGQTGTFDDLLCVQIMLKFIFTNNLRLKKLNPVKGEITVSGQPAPDTPLLIASYQKHIMHRPARGFLNPAIGSDEQKGRTTIWNMNSHIGVLLAADKSPIHDSVELVSTMPTSPLPLTEGFYNQSPRYFDSIR